MKASPSGLFLSLATIAAILATLGFNVLSNFFPPGGLNIGEISNTLLAGVQIIPASYAFSIWGLIYLGLIAYGVYQFLPSQRQNSTLRWVNIFLIGACVAQILWVYLFTVQQFWLSVLVMLAILLPLIGAYLQLKTHPVRSRQRKWFADLPFSIYLAWISVATIVNVASALYSSGWRGWGIGETGWTAVMLVIGVAIAGILAIQQADIAFTLVFVWAYIAIAVRQADNSTILITAILGAIALAALLWIGITRNRNRKTNPV
ncbi:MAG: tryptophan-rich sensory protein [Desertifilum sp. SIO1I2]|nr:tryptophan-rich sensory protein [Desertifilum sp. SIO1I2]